MKTYFFTLFSLLLSMIAVANNITISNISVVNNAGNTGKIIEFDVSWENSWRTAATGNWDAAWVFFKFRDNDGKWYPLRFNGNNITMPAGVSYEMGNNGATVGVGMFLYRSALGAGTFTITDARAGIQTYPGTFDIRGFVVEMVYIPQGSFWVGDGGSNKCYQNGSAVNGPFQITGNGASITMGTANGTLYDPDGTNSGNLSGFPAGYSAYWMMKYEVSQGGYRDFLNTLTYAQQVNRLAVVPTSVTGTNISPGYAVSQYRQYIEIATPGVNSSSTPAVVGCDADGDNIYNEATDGEWVIVSTVSWSDIAAYLDWAGLRPMTELEFEKACRGTLNPLLHEFAWGNDNISSNAYTVTNSGMTNESISNASAFMGNALNSLAGGIYYVRVGIFATALSTRVSSGAGYYGAMDLSGQGSEETITTANVAGRAFTGKHGDGVLSTVGNANENNWPGINGATGNATAPGIYDGGDGVRSDGGTKGRGGSFSDFDDLRVSHRLGVGTGTAVQANGSNKNGSFGIRGVRDSN